ncbi:MAG: thioredoxin family protein [Opitutaceae bacterium]
MLPNIFRISCCFLLSLVLTPALLTATTISIGASYGEVIIALGEPDGELKAGSKHILTYGEAKIALKNEQVVSVSPRLNELLAKRAAKTEMDASKKKAGLVSYRGQWVTPAEKEVLSSAESLKKNNRLAHKSTGVMWYEHFMTAYNIAQKEDKKLLLNFTGSDWCGWCIRLDEEVFSQQEFLKYASEHYILVTIDFPRNKTLSKETIEQNKTLAKKFRVTGYPTIAVLNPDGTLHKMSGYVEGGAEAFLKSIQ